MNEKLLGFHVSRLARDRYQFEEKFFSFLGKAQINNFYRAREFATHINQKRDIANFPSESVLASEVNAVALIHGITHHLFRLYCENHPQLLAQALEYLQSQFSSNAVNTLDRFVDEFPPQPVYKRLLDREAYLAGTHEERANTEAALEELIMLWLANQNPAFAPVAPLFDDELLERQTAYTRITDALNNFFSGVADTDPAGERFPSGMSILDILLEPVRQSPFSLEGQLRVLVERWGAVIGTTIYRLLTAMDIIREDTRPVPGPGDGGKPVTYVPYYDLATAEHEPENFTPDREWMPNLVMIAKNAYVWLDQLSRKYGRAIVTLDQVPDEELDQLAAWGFTGLWLIGLWERSEASQRIKQLCGNPDAVASAYSLLRYEIAGRLGGDAACDDLRRRAWRRGIRLASDMVPNHMGIDSDWVMDHPDWFLSLNYSPYPNYTFNGVDLSHNPAVGIYLEDHYYDRSDAAVVFKRVDHNTGDTRYIYHGNDGTSMPWNDTAQINYLNPQVREAMIQVILNIARQFPIIRFDAAMTLVKKHVQRLWFPEPGTGGAIPSRSEHGLTKAEFEQLMPEEFWREVIERAAVEAPDTLLLAEAFWLLESYFVRTLGMHRVYNSAYMHMMRDEDNAKYRLVLKNTLEFDPEILRRYVNFLNNPDEKTAVEQFGKGDKYFGVTTMLMTMPGLPMVGHGQVEGFAEKYGMEYYRAYWDESPDDHLIRRHEHEIFPLMKRRYLFAGVENFLLYDFYAVGGGVDENVFAYSNRVGDERSIVLYNNVFSNTRGYIRISSAFSIKSDDGSRVLTQRTLGEGLDITPDENQYCIFKDYRSGAEYIRNCRDLCHQGLYFELNAYQTIVLLDFRIVTDTPTGQYRQLAERLGGRGVPSIDEAFRELMVEPIQIPFRELVNGDLFRRLLEIRAADAEAEDIPFADVEVTFDPDEETADESEPHNRQAVFTEVEDKLLALYQAIERFTGEPVGSIDGVPHRTNAALVKQMRQQLETLLALPLPGPDGPAHSLFSKQPDDPALWGGLLGWLFVHSLGEPAQVRSWLDEWMLGRIIADAARELGADDQRAKQALRAVKLATAHHDSFVGQTDEAAFRLLETLLQDTDAQGLLEVNHFQGIVWFNQEGFDHLLRWLTLLPQIVGTPAGNARRQATIEQLRAAAAQSGYQLDKLRAAAKLAAND